MVESAYLFAGDWCCFWLVLLRDLTSLNFSSLTSLNFTSLALLLALMPMMM
jgi:hypothetical protein